MDEKPEDKADAKTAGKPAAPALDIPVKGKLPPRKIGFFNWSRAVTLFEIFAGLAFLFVLLVGLFFWRVSSSPVDMAFAKPYIEEALSNRKRHITAQLGSVVLHWPDLAGPILLDVRDAKVLGADDKPIVEVDEASISLSKAGLLIGQVLPVGLILKHPALTVIRDKDGTFDIGFGSAVSTQDVQSQTDLTSVVLQYIARPGVERGSGSPLATLKLFEIQDAQVNLEDLKTGTSSFLPNVNVQFQSTAEGLDCDASIDFSDTPEWPSHLRANVLIPWEGKDVVLDASLENFDLTFLSDKIPALSILDGQDVEVDGRLYAVLDANFVPQQAQLVANSEAGSFDIPEFSKERVPYSNFTFEADYNAGTGKLSLKNTQVTLKDVTLNAEADLGVTDNSVSGPLKFSIKDLKQAQIKPLWPVALEGDNAEEWIVQKMSEGTFHDVSAVIDLFAARGQDGWEYGAQDAHASFAFDGMTVHYRDPLLPVEKAKGKGTFDLAEEKLAIAIDDAMISDLKVDSADLEFVNIIEHGKGKADLRIKLGGPLQSALKYLSLEPISLKHSFDLQKVKGTAKATVNINFPAHKDIKVEDVKVNAEGTMSDVTLPGVMKKLTLTGGPLDFSVKDNAFKLAGKAKIEGQDATINYFEFLNADGQVYKSKIQANLLVDNDMRKLIGMDLSDFLDGPAQVDAVYTEYNGGKAEANLNVGLNPSHVYYKPFGYDKAPGVDGTATLKATLQNGALKSISGLDAKAPGMEIKNANFSFKDENKLSGGELPNFTVGDTAGDLKFSVNGGGKYTINLSGSFLDLRPFLENDKEDEPYTAPPMAITMKADKMRIAEWDTVRNGNLTVDIDGEGHFNSMTMDGVAGKSDFFIRYAPDESGARTFRMGSQDAGGVLRAFGIYENIVGGELTVQGDPIHGLNDRNVKGTAQITNFKVVKAPTLARLLSMVSLTGVMSALSGEGLAFSKLEAKFNWLYRPKGSLLRVRDGRTSGNSVGFTFDGTYDQNASTIEVEGTMIPLSGVNKVIGSIPLVGDILTGGTGAVVAATYSVKGDTKSPSVFVNPLSVLTPGILRRILFEQ